MQEGVARVNGTRLYYQIAGSGVPLVLIHGFALDSRMWEPQWQAFTPRFRVLRYDLRGFGQSARPSGEPYTHAEDLKALLDYHQMDKAMLLGCSMGGGVAIDFAFSFPQRVQILVPYDAVIGGFPWSPEFSGTLLAIHAKAKEAGVEAAKALWSQNPMFKGTLQRPHSALLFKQMLDTYSRLHWLGKDSARRYDPPAFQRLGEIQAPTFVLVGENDVPDLQGVATTLAQRIQGAQQQILSNVGHLGNLEDPKDFNQTVLGLLYEGPLTNRTLPLR